MTLDPVSITLAASLGVRPMRTIVPLLCDPLFVACLAAIVLPPFVGWWCSTREVR